MALRIRYTGEIYCAAHTEEQEGDTYIDDGLHYTLSVLVGAIRPSKTHFQDNLWFWNIHPDSIDHLAEIEAYDNISENKIKECESKIKIKKPNRMISEDVEKILTTKNPNIDEDSYYLGRDYELQYEVLKGLSNFVEKKMDKSLAV